MNKANDSMKEALCTTGMVSESCKVISVLGRILGSAQLAQCPAAFIVINEG